MFSTLREHIDSVDVSKMDSMEKQHVEFWKKFADELESVGVITAKARAAQHVDVDPKEANYFIHTARNKAKFGVSNENDQYYKMAKSIELTVECMHRAIHDPEYRKIFQHNGYDALDKTTLGMEASGKSPEEIQKVHNEFHTAHGIQDFKLEDFKNSRDAELTAKQMEPVYQDIKQKYEVSGVLSNIADSVTAKTAELRKNMKEFAKAADKHFSRNSVFGKETKAVEKFNEKKAIQDLTPEENIVSDKKKFTR